MCKIKFTFWRCLLCISIIFFVALPVGAQVFTIGDRYETGARPDAIVAADFDGDDDIDLAVGHFESTALIIFTNDGDGNFTATDTALAFPMKELYTADLNGDGWFDLMACQDFGAQVNFWYSNGDGTFDVGLSQAFGVWPEALCAADFDGDDIIDVAYNNIFTGSGISIKFGLGDGIFEASTLIVPNIHGFWIGAGDFDDDGDVDIVFDSTGIDYTILNNGDGTFADRVLSPGVVSNYTVTDLNGDEYPDLVGLRTLSCQGNPAYTLGTPEGSFPEFVWPWVVTGWEGTHRPAVADFNGDGYTDIAICSRDKWFVDCGLNNGNTIFNTWANANFADAGACGIATGDFDGDGDNDLVVTCLDDSLTIILSQAAQHARKVVVPDDYATVQEAVDAAWNFDTILVCPGIYYGSIDFHGRNLVLMSDDCAKNGTGYDQAGWFERSLTTILDGGGTGSVITFDDGEDSCSVVSGFTIQNGFTAGYGGAIFCYDTAAPTITHNIIRNNTAGAGGGIFVAAGPADISNNLIIDNHATVYGGGIYVSGGTGNITNNTFYGNTTVDGGGGLCFGYGTTVVSNNIFWNNSSTSNGQEIDTFSMAPVITYCDIQGGWPGEGNFDDYPMFVDTANNDFNLMAGSPCINAGDPDSPLDPDGTVADVGSYFYFDPVDVEDDADGTAHPSSFFLAQNFPNPFNPSTTIEYSLPGRMHVSIDVFNILGRRVNLLVDREQAAGSYNTIWDGRDISGRPVSTGVYFYRLRAGNLVEIRKLMLLK